MVIKASASVEVRTLVAALGSADEVAREGAVARLAVIGARAMDRLMAAFDEATDRRTRLAVLRTFEAIGDYRAGPPARRALIDGGDLAVAATAVLRRLLTSSREASAAEALDALVATALDTSNDRRVRLAAVEALEDTAGDVGKRLAQTFRQDQGGARHKPSVPPDADEARLEAIWQDAVEGRLWDDPQVLRNALAAHASSAPLNTLRKMIEAVRLREEADPVSDRDAWRSLRGALHQALALRGSRVALYDLRESLGEGETPARLVAPSFLAALHLIGDESCLEPLAALWERASGDERRRHHLESAFQAIVRRERIGPGHKVLKRLKARGSGLLADS
jgi:hypothetical protein